MQSTFSACHLVLDDLCKVLGCSVIIDSKSTKFGFQKFFFLTND